MMTDIACPKFCAVDNYECKYSRQVSKDGGAHFYTYCTLFNRQTTVPDSKGLRILLARLDTYPGAHPNEKWKREKNLNMCTQREKDEMKKYGVDEGDLMALDFDRGQVSHVLFGYKFAVKNTPKDLPFC